MNIFQDQDGNKSSKRIFGFIALLIGVLILTTVSTVSIFVVVADAGTVIDAGKFLTTAGAGMITAGVIEKFAKK